MDIMRNLRAVDVQKMAESSDEIRNLHEKGSGMVI